MDSVRSLNKIAIQHIVIQIYNIDIYVFIYNKNSSENYQPTEEYSCIHNK